MAVDRFVTREEDSVRVVEDGRTDAPVVLLLGNLAVPMLCWDPVVPWLDGAFRVIRLDFLNGGGLKDPGRRYDISTLAHRAAMALERLGVSRVTVIGHSSGCTIATALAEQRPDAVAGLALIDMGPDLDAKIPERLLFRLSLTAFPGRLLWQLRTGASVRKAAASAFTRPVEIPDAFVAQMLRVTHRDFVGAMHAPLRYLGQRSLPDRLAPLGLQVLVLFGAEDQRWRSSSAAAYRAVPGARVELLPGVGHTPMMEDPERTGPRLLQFAQAVAPTR
jgi:pimeloyl-ACP methyl ester carboxylesterase